MRQHLLEQLPVEALEKLFSNKGGRPRKDFHLVLWVLILEAVAFNLAWHYALGIVPYSKIFLCERTLRNDRRVVIEQGLEQQCEWAESNGDLNIQIKVPDEIPCDTICLLRES